jgi:hypothetical protein
MRTGARVLVPVVLGMAALCPAGNACAQDIGHKVLGALGIDAGVQNDPGLFFAERFLYFTADEVVDRNGHALPLRGFESHAIGNAVGIAFTLKLPRLPYLSAAAALPVARITASSDEPRASLDRSGLGDIAVKPLQIGWRLPHVDLLASYTLYIPTGVFTLEGGEGISRGNFTHQGSAGVAVFFDQKRRWRASALVSYDHNLRKIGLDITRGDTVQVQGGVGARFFDLLDIGLAGYALWQVSNDTGTALPAVLRGARDRVFGLGPEVDVLIPPIQARLGARFLWDFGARSRPEGQVFVLSLTFLCWPVGRS